MPVIQATDVPYAGYPLVEPDPKAPPTRQDIQSTVADFGGLVGAATSRLGEGFTQAGQSFAEAALARQTLFNQVAAADATNKYQEAETALLHGDPNNPNDVGFFGLKGENAMRAFPNVSQALIAKRAEIRDGLQNPRQQVAFDGETRWLQARALDRMGAHYDTQFNKYHDSVDDATYKNAGNRVSGAIAVGDENALLAGINTQLQTVEGALRRNGVYSTERMKVESDTIWTDAIQKQAEHIAQTNPFRALKFLEGHSDKMIKDKYNTLHETLRSKAAETQSRIDRDLEKPPPDYDSKVFRKSAKIGPLADTVITTARAEGASPAFVTALLAHGQAEGGFDTEWDNVGKQGERGHWQMLPDTGELPEYEKRNKTDHSTVAQTKYVLARLKESGVDIARDDVSYAMDAMTMKFERYKGHGPGQRREYLP